MQTETVVQNIFSKEMRRSLDRAMDKKTEARDLTGEIERLGNEISRDFFHRNETFGPYLTHGTPDRLLLNKACLSETQRTALKESLSQKIKTWSFANQEDLGFLTSLEIESTRGQNHFFVVYPKIMDMTQILDGVGFVHVDTVELPTIGYKLGHFAL